MSETPHSNRAHAVCSASGAERWLNCPGSVGLSQGLPDQPPTPAALEGTRAHELAEKILRDWEAKDRVLDHAFVESLRPEYEDTEFETGDGRMWSMLDYAMTYVNLCLEQVGCFDSRPAVRIEHRLTLNADLGMFGTIDFVATGQRKGAYTGIVVDFKFGKKKVNAEENKQLAYYAAALKRNSKKPLEQVKVVVVQPRVAEFFSETWYSEADLDGWTKRLEDGAERAVRQLMRLEPKQFQKGAWCWFCPAKSVCPEMEKARLAEAVDDFSD
jgi:hypothetical protein